MKQQHTKGSGRQADSAIAITEQIHKSRHARGSMAALFIAAAERKANEQQKGAR